MINRLIFSYFIRVIILYHLIYYNIIHQYSTLIVNAHELFWQVVTGRPVLRTQWIMRTIEISHKTCWLLLLCTLNNAKKNNNNWQSYSTIEIWPIQGIGGGGQEITDLHVLTPSCCLVRWGEKWVNWRMLSCSLILKKKSWAAVWSWPRGLFDVEDKKCVLHEQVKKGDGTSEHTIFKW